MARVVKYILSAAAHFKTYSTLNSGASWCQLYGGKAEKKTAKQLRLPTPTETSQTLKGLGLAADTALPDVPG